MSGEENDYNNNTPDLSQLAALIYVFGINKRLWEFVDAEIAGEPDEEEIVVELGSILDRFGIRESGWNVLARRFGFERRQTLDAIAGHLSITRECVRQKEKRGLDKLHARIRSVAPLLKPLEGAVKQSWRELRQANSVNEAVTSMQDLNKEADDQSYNQTLTRLLILLRALAQTEYSELENLLPHLTYFACSLPPVVVKHSRVGQEEGERQRQQSDATHKWKYAELAELVLKEAGEPLHYMVIAERAEALGKRENFTLKAIHNVLLSHTGKFAYVAQGTYGLTAWGLASVDTYVDVIADALKQSKKSLSYGDLFQHVNAVRPVKTQTFQMTLDMHPRFYQSKQESYGLRAWLSPREKQTLRTPDWLVETPSSHERVKRSAERGYDVEMIVAQDKISNG